MIRTRVQIICDNKIVVAGDLNRGPSPWIPRAAPYAHKAAEGRWAMKWLTRMIAHLIETGQVEMDVDKKGRTFCRMTGGPVKVDRPRLTIKSLVWYVADGHIRILTNVGSVNRRTGKRWSQSITMTLKEVSPNCVIVLDGNKRQIVPRRGWGSYQHIAYGDKDSFIPTYDLDGTELPF